MLQQLNTTMPQLVVGKLAPNFTLTDLSGAPVTRGAYRARRHLVLLLVPSIDARTRAYIEELRDTYATIRAAEGEILVLVADPAADTESLRASLETPFPILIDPEGAVSKKYLPDDARYGVFVLDRYGAIHAQWAIVSLPLPYVADVVDWVEVIDLQCVL